LLIFIRPSLQDPIPGPVTEHHGH